MLGVPGRGRKHRLGVAEARREEVLEGEVLQMAVVEIEVGFEKVERILTGSSVRRRPTLRTELSVWEL